MVVPAYILCLMTNLFLAWMSYHLLDRIGLKLGKWIWDGKWPKFSGCAMERTTAPN
jgi:peptidoglycan/LPS O-acetylase OafA/YrhL